jgi:hypothetical protein
VSGSATKNKDIEENYDEDEEEEDDNRTARTR